MNLHKAERDVRCESSRSFQPEFMSVGMKTPSGALPNGFRAARVSLTGRELSQVKHDLQVALAEVLTTDEERRRTSQAHQQQQETTGALRRQLLDAEEKVSSSPLQLGFSSRLR